MKLIRYILSHALLLAFLVVLGFAYHYRVKLFSAEINRQIDKTVGVVMDKARGITEVFYRGKQKQQEKSAPVAVVATEPPAVKTKAAPEIVPAKTAPVETTEFKVSPPHVEVTESTATKTPGKTEEAGLADTPKTDEKQTVSTDREVVAPVAAKPEVAPASDAQAAARSHAELLGEARSVFQQGDMTKSIALYQELAELNPGDPNVFGELGNVYYSQGQWEKAGIAYYQAASLLLDQGQMRQVQYLYRVIQGLDQESANKLREKLGR